MKRKKRAAGLALVVRHGRFHVQGTVTVADASCRVRESTGIQAGEENRATAEAVRHKIETEKRNELLHGIKPSVEIEIAVAGFLAEPRERPLNEVDVKRLEEIMEAFRGCKLNTISQTHWDDYMKKRMANCALSTRERYLNILMALLNHAHGKGWLVVLPKFKRIAGVRKPKHRRARRVAELTDELIVLMAANAGPHLSGQIAMMWTARQRVSSSLYGCRVCDYVATPGLEQITFHDTKNGEPVIAAVHSAAALLMKGYLAWRGDLHDREAPLFLTHRRKPYADNDKAYGGQTKRAFQGMKQRTVRSLRDRAAAQASDLRRLGERADARSVIGKAKEQASLVAQVTPHWFRHRLATTMLSKTGDLRAVMEQGGWSSDIVLSYAHDVSAQRRKLVNQMVGALADIDTSLTRGVERDEKDV